MGIKRIKQKQTQKMTQKMTQKIHPTDFESEKSLKNIDALTNDTDIVEENQSDLYFKTSRKVDYDFNFDADKKEPVLNKITKLIKGNFKPWKNVK